MATSVLTNDDHLLTRFGPVDTVEALHTFFFAYDGINQVIASTQRLLVGLLIASLAGVPIGIAIGISKPLESASSVLMQFLRMISPLSWTPIALILFGIGDAPVYFLVGIGSVWPIVISTAAGVKSVDPRWKLLAKSLGATPIETLITIILPAIQTHVLTGIRVALGIGWVVLVPAEMLGVDNGLGYSILDARDRLEYGEVTAVILVIGFIGFVMDFASRNLLSKVNNESPVAT